MTIKSEYERLLKICKDSYKFSGTLKNVKQYTCASDYIKKGIEARVKKEVEQAIVDRALEVISKEEFEKEVEILSCIYKSIK